VPGSHRGRPRRLRAFAPAAIASIVAVVLVIAAIVAVDVLRHRGSSNASSPAVSAPPTSPGSATPTPTPTPTTPTPTPTTPSATKAAPPTHAAPVVIVTPPPSSTPVAVYNNSRVPHRASLAASRLRAAGYPVTDQATRPTYPGTNVVYYPPGNASLAAAARGLVARHLGIVAAAPRPASIRATAGLIVVVTSSYS
jgi:cytoskeletal protein RodZ